MSLDNGYSGLYSGFSGLGSTSALYSGVSGLYSSPPVFLSLPSTPLAIYSLVKTPTWAGACIRIKRASNNDELDIGFGGDGRVNMSAAFSFAAGSTITVVTWYDQSGNGYDATATSNQPTIISGNTIGGVQPISFVDSTGQGSTRLNIPAGLTVNSQSYTVAMAYAHAIGSVGNYNTMFALGNASGNSYFCFWDKINFNMNSSANGTSKFSAASKIYYTPRYCEVDSLITGSDATNIFLRNNGTSGNATAVASSTFTGGEIGATSLNASFTYSGQEVFAVVIYNTTLNTTDRTTIDTAFSSAFTANRPFTAKVFFDGDSITAGGTTGAYLYGYPRVINDALGLSSATYNFGIAGQTMATCYTNRNNVINRYDAAYTNNVNMIFAGTNDIAGRASGTIVGFGATIWTSYLLPYIHAVQAAGFNHVLVGTIIDRTWTGSGTDKSQKETERLAYNTLIRDNALTYGYTVVDFASLSEMSDSTNTTYFVDGVHPTRLGYNVMGTYAAPLISPWTT